MPAGGRDAVCLGSCAAPLSGGNWRSLQRSVKWPSDERGD